MPTPSSPLREEIQRFIQQRLHDKLEKIDKQQDKADTPEKQQALQESRQKLLDEHQPATWLESAARRAPQLQQASHILKFSHPSAKTKVGNLLLSEPALERDSPYLATHSLLDNLELDVTGNAAALDVYKFLLQEYQGTTLLQRAVAQDPELLAALSDDPEEAQRWSASFASIARPPAQPASHTLARQIYFPLPDGSYHLLAPLYPTSLAHALYQQIQDDRFSDTTKAAREARRKEQPADHGYREYPGLASIIYGGSKPQNISQLNSQRGGTGYLLPSCPPHWQQPKQRPPFGVTSLFSHHFGRRKGVQEALSALKKLLVGDYNNIHIRRRRAQLVEQLGDELLLLIHWLQQLPPGWSADPRCRLENDEQLLLDPGRATTDPAFAAQRSANDWHQKTAARFGRWLNQQLRTRTELPLGDTEQREWEESITADLREISHA